MPVYHFTDHAYRNWRPDHPRGYTRKGEGVLPPDAEMADDYDEAAKQDAVVFTEEIQREILVLAHQIGEEEGWRLEATGFDEGHAHHVISWRGFIHGMKCIGASRTPSRSSSTGDMVHQANGGSCAVTARRDVSSTSSTSIICSRVYLPDYPGIFWKRGMELPMLPEMS